MSLQVKTKTDVQYHPIFLQILEDIPGGITLDTDRIPTATTEIKKGALLSRIITTLGTTLTSAGIYRLVKTTKLQVDYATANCVTLVVYSNQEFKVGEIIGAARLFGDAGSGNVISAINKGATGVGTDELILSGGGFSAGTLDKLAILHEVSALDSSMAPLYTAQAILRDNVQVREADLTTLDNITSGAVIRATVNERLMPYFVSVADKASLIAINHMRFV